MASGRIVAFESYPLSPGAQQIMARKTSGTAPQPPTQTHHYHVKVNTHDERCQCCDTRDDVTMGTSRGSATRPPNGRNATQLPPNGAPGALSRGERLAGQPADPVAWINGMCDRIEQRLAAIFERLGLDLPPTIEPPTESWLD